MSPIAIMAWNKSVELLALKRIFFPLKITLKYITFGPGIRRYTSPKLKTSSES